MSTYMFYVYMGVDIQHGTLYNISENIEINVSIYGA